jgi:hypothetical protein
LKLYQLYTQTEAAKLEFDGFESFRGLYLLKLIIKYNDKLSTINYCLKRYCWILCFQLGVEAHEASA